MKKLFDNYYFLFSYGLKISNYPGTILIFFQKLQTRSKNCSIKLFLFLKRWVSASTKNQQSLREVNFSIFSKPLNIAQC